MGSGEPWLARDARPPQLSQLGPPSHPVLSPKPADQQPQLKPGLSPSPPFLLRKQELAEQVGFLLVLATSFIVAAAAAGVYCCGWCSSWRWSWWGAGACLAHSLPPRCTSPSPPL